MASTSANMAFNFRHPLMSFARAGALGAGLTYGWSHMSAIRSEYMKEQTDKIYSLEKEVKSLRGEVASAKAGSATLEEVGKGQATIDQWIAGMAAK